MTRIHLVFALGLVGCSSSTTTLGEGTMTTQLEAPRLASALDTQVAKWSAEGLPSTLNDGRRKNFEEIAQWLATRLQGGATADKSCPFVPGADLRVAVPYIDPKLSDGTEQETATYLAKSEEIGREMVWLMNRVTELLP